MGLFSPELDISLKISSLPELVPLDLAQESDDVWLAIRKGFAIPDIENADVQSHEKRLMKNNRMFSQMLERSEPYIYFIANDCQKRGLPTEIALIPFLESQFNPHAQSHMSAAGLWQFMPGTGRNFDLKQNKWVDERKDLIASTHAALDYLSYLYEMHGDWHLALASYNLGEGTVSKAVKKARDARVEPSLQSIDLPKETRTYVPRLQALKNLIMTPGKYGIELPKFPNQPYFVEIKRKKDVDLREIAKNAGIDLAEFRKLNPGLKQPVLNAAYTNSLLVPVEYKQRIEKSLLTYAPASVYQTYTVLQGDTLNGIARKLDVQTSILLKLNKLQKRSVLKPGTVLDIPKPMQSSAWSSF